MRPFPNIPIITPTTNIHIVVDNTTGQANMKIDPVIDHVQAIAILCALISDLCRQNVQERMKSIMPQNPAGNSGGNIGGISGGGPIAS